MYKNPALIAVAVFAGALAQAQDNPISANMKQSWANVKGLLQRTAEKMPDENYSFKPSPEMQSFGQRMGHVISFNIRGCSGAQGEAKNVQIPPSAGKSDIMTALQQMNEVCDAAFNALTDADAVKMISAGRGGQRMKLALLQGTVLEHSQEMYGYMAVYLRLKGIVPPTSDRNER